MVVEATRGVKFILMAVTDDSIGREFGKITDYTDALQKRMSGFRVSAPDLSAFKTGVEQAHSILAANEEKMNGHTTNGAAKRAAANGAAAKVQAEQEKELTRQAEAETEKRAALPDKVIQNRIKMLARIQKFEANKEAAEAKAAEKQQAQLEKTAEAAARAAEKQQAQNDKVQEKRKAALDKATQADKDYWDSFVAYGQKAAARRAADEEKDARQRERDQEKLSEAHERAQRKIEQQSIRIRQSLAEVASGATELARGFVEIGLVGEEDFDKIKDSILRVQGAIDYVRGGINTFNALSEAAMHYREKLELVAKAGELAGKVKGGYGAIGSAGTLGAGSAVAGGAEAAGGAAAGIVGPVVAAITGVAAAVASFVLTAREAVKHGVGGGATQGSVVDRVASWEAGMAEWQGGILRSIGVQKEWTFWIARAGMEAAEASEKTSRMTKTLAEEAKQRDEINRNRTLLYQEASRDSETRLQAKTRFNAVQADVGQYATPQQQLAAHRTQLDADREAVEAERARINQQLRDTHGPQGQQLPGHEEAERQAEEFEQKIFGLKQRELELAHEERRVSIEAAREKLQIMASQLANLKQQKEAARNEEIDSAAAFGRLSRAKQQQALKLRERIEQGDIQNFTRHELERVEQFGDARGKAESRREFARRGNETIGGSVFGAEERQNAVNIHSSERLANQEFNATKAAAEAANRAEFKLNVSNQIEVKVNGDSDLESKVKAAVKEAAKQAMQSQDDRIQRYVQEAFEQAKAEMKQAMRQRGQRAAAATS